MTDNIEPGKFTSEHLPAQSVSGSSDNYKEQDES
jgi:hypothetical protein